MKAFFFYEDKATLPDKCIKYIGGYSNNDHVNTCTTLFIYNDEKTLTQNFKLLYLE